MIKFSALFIAVLIFAGAIFVGTNWMEAERLQAREREQIKFLALRDKHTRKVKDGGKLVILPETGLCAVQTKEFDLLPCDMAEEISLLTGERISLLY